MARSADTRRTALIAFIFLLLAVTFSGTILSNKNGNDLYISEVCPHNENVIHDSVGFYQDYIVLTNPSDHMIDLEGYGLSDKRSELREFVFSGSVIQPLGTLVVWTDYPSQFGDGYYDEDAIYTDFKISDHEYLYLTDPYGRVIDSLRIPNMSSNEVLLRDKPNARGSVGTSGFIKKSTPVVSKDIEPPRMSADSGFYEHPFELSMSGKYDVYYTDDGSNPYLYGKPYEGQIQIIDRSDLPDIYSVLGPVSAAYEQFYPDKPVAKSTIIRAVSQRDDGTFSEESVATFFVGKEVRDICSDSYIVSMVSNPDGLFSDYDGIYMSGITWELNSEKVASMGADPVYAPANYNMRGKGWRRGAKLMLFDPDGNCLYDEDDIVSIRGKSSRAVVQKGFNIRPQTDDGTVFNGLIDGAGDILMLRTGSAEDVFLTNFRDALNARIADNLKVGAQRSLCCQMFLNGEYWGCYSLQEHLDTSFIEARYNVSAENVNLIKIDGEPEVPSELTSDLNMYQDVERFLAEHDLSVDADYKQFCDMVDIDSAIDYYCAEIFFANDDAYLGNKALWRARNVGPNPYEDGKWRFLLFDLDNTDGYAPNAGADIDSFIDGSYAGYNATDDLFFSGLIKNSDFRQRFRERFEELLANDFSYETVEKIIDEFENRYEEPMVSSVRRFHDAEFTEKQYHENVRVVREFFRERGRYIGGYLELHMGESGR